MENFNYEWICILIFNSFSAFRFSLKLVISSQFSKSSTRVHSCFHQTYHQAIHIDADKLHQSFSYENAFLSHLSFGPLWIQFHHQPYCTLVVIHLKNISHTEIWKKNCPTYMQKILTQHATRPVVKYYINLTKKEIMETRVFTSQVKYTCF